MQKTCAQRATERRGGVRLQLSARTKIRCYTRRACAKHAILMSITETGLILTRFKVRKKSKLSLFSW